MPFDPNKPFKVKEEATKKKFDPNKPFVSKEEEASSKPSAAESGIRSFAKNITMGGAPVLEAAAKSAIGDKDFSENLYETEKKYKEAEKVNPGASGLGEAAGYAMDIGTLGLTGLAKAGITKTAVKDVVKSAVKELPKKARSLEEFTVQAAKNIEDKLSIPDGSLLRRVSNLPGAQTVKTLFKGVGDIGRKAEVTAAQKTKIMEKLEKSAWKTASDVAEKGRRDAAKSLKTQVDEFVPAPIVKPAPAKEAAEKSLQETVSAVTRSKGVDLSPADKIKAGKEAAKKTHEELIEEAKKAGKFKRYEEGQYGP
jgi:hypothetical protein